MSLLRSRQTTARILLPTDSDLYRYFEAIPCLVQHAGAAFACPHASISARTLAK